MHSEKQFPSQKPTLPFADQGGRYWHNAPVAPAPFFGGSVSPFIGESVAPFFDRSVFPPVEKHLMPFHGVNLQSSEACPRNFIICDQTEKQSQIMFHPAISSKFYYPDLNVSFPPFQDNAKKNDANYGREISSLKEDSDDIDALLSFEEEEEEECDDEEVSTARTHGICGGDSSDSCSTHDSRPRKSRFSSFPVESNGCDSNSSGRKRQKMRKMVKALKRIVPGGNRMNTVTVLDEAVRYLKTLKVEVQTLGVKNFKS